MSNPASLSFQAACIRDVLTSARTPEIRAGLEGAIDTLERVSAAREPIRTMLEIYGVFPGADVKVTRP